MSSQVTVSKGLLAALAGVAAAAVLGLAFLLGRSSVHGAPAEAPRAPAAPSPGAPVVPSLPAPVPAAETPAPAPPAAPASAPAAPSAPVPQDDPDRAAVVAYFKAVDRIQAQGSGDPETVAGQILGGLGKGDTSGLEDMIRQAQATRDKLAALGPPRPCAAYHQESLGILDGSMDMMRAIMGALASSTPPPDDLTRRANALNARTQALQAQEQALRRRYHE